jgi:hypothetical protein
MNRKTVPIFINSSCLRLFQRHFSTGVALLTISIFIAFVLLAALQKCETIDEGLFIAGGVAQVYHLNPNIDLTHPPLLRWLSGIPAVFLGKARGTDPTPFIDPGPMDLFVYKIQEVFDFAVHFFYDSGNDHDRVLFWGRLPFVFLGALLGWLIFSEARRRFGTGPAFVSLLAFLFTPEILAHAQWAHADLASALTLFLISLALARALMDHSWQNDLQLGGAMGLAVATKLTALLLWPMVFVLLLWFEKGSFFCFLKRMAMIVLVFYAAIIIAYLPDPRLFGPHQFYKNDLTRLGLEWAGPVLQILPLPDTFLKGVIYTLLLGQRGQIAFFHGEVSVTGWWHYFPAAIFLKYPTGLLLAGVAGLAAFWKAPLPKPFKASLTFPPFMILLAAMIQSVNIGVRSVLPFAPFLAFWTGAAIQYFKTRWIRVILIALVVTSIASGIAAYPNFLSYFNPLLGGTAAADKWLIDSNLDWGQDLPELSRELKRRDIQEVRLAYFGMGRPSHFGIRVLNPNIVAPGWYAISRSYLAGWWPPGDPYGWLRNLEPITLVGGSIALFHVDETDLEKLEIRTINR